jgi:hypothetical protein
MKSAAPPQAIGEEVGGEDHDDVVEAEVDANWRPASELQSAIQDLGQDAGLQQEDASQQEHQQRHKLQDHVAAADRGKSGDSQCGSHKHRDGLSQQQAGTYDRPGHAFALGQVEPAQELPHRAWDVLAQIGDQVEAQGSPVGQTLAHAHNCLPPCPKIHEVRGDEDGKRQHEQWQVKSPVVLSYLFPVSIESPGKEEKRESDQQY